MLEIDRALNGHDLSAGELILTDSPELLTPFEIVSRPRVGVDYAGQWAEKPLRFYIGGNKHISRA